MSESLIKLTPPYYAVVFASKQKVMDQEYQDTANRLFGLAQKNHGFLGMEMAGDDSLAIGVIYWKTLEAIESWKNHPEHIPAKEKGNPGGMKIIEFGFVKWKQNMALNLSRFSPV